MRRGLEKDVHAWRFEVVFVHFVDIAQVVVHHDDFSVRVVSPHDEDFSENTSYGETNVEDVQLHLLFNERALDGAGFSISGFSDDQCNCGWWRNIHECVQSHCEAACL